MVAATYIDGLVELHAIVSPTTGNRHCASGVRWQLNVQMEAVPMRGNSILVGLEPPTHTYFTVLANITTVCRCDVATWNGRNLSTLPTWLRRRETTNVGMDPVAYRPKSVVIYMLSQ